MNLRFQKEKGINVYLIKVLFTKSDEEPKSNRNVHYLLNFLNAAIN